jgi:class 3 adenylate cyclase
VKSIGDEVMIAAGDAASVTAIALTLIRERRDDHSVLARAGVSAGHVLFRLGDYYGPVVNLASRLTDEAAPDEVLADRVAAASTGVTAVPAGRLALKGFPEPVEVWTVTGVELG